MTPFWRLYSGLHREGPGTAADVLWALDRAEVPDRAAICDAGAGSGADTLTLAQARPRATVLAVEKAAHLVEQANQRLKNHPNAHAVQGDIAKLPGSYDFIWCAGALYFLGVTEGLSLWRKALPSGARVAFSEPCYLSSPPDDHAKTFWADYPRITDLAGIADRVAGAGFRVIDSRMIVGQGWAGYYASLGARIDMLRPGADPDLTAVLDESAAEIANWRAAPDHIAYALTLVEPT